MNRARNNNTTTPRNGMNGTIPDNRNGMNGTIPDNRNGMNGTIPDNRNGMNGAMPDNRGGMNGRNPGGTALTGSLADQIRALCFVKTELELYLDTHPRCRTALDYYYQTVEELKRLTEQYENTVGPLTAMGNVSTDRWTWVDGPWPWQMAGDFMREGNR